MIRTLIVDDEPLARERLRLLLEVDPEVELIDECETGPDALEAILTEAPDLVFLDVQMPDLNGFDVLGELPEERRPHVVFVTAFDQYALQAFDVHAVDYLLKPFDRDRFEQALERAKRRLVQSDPSMLHQRIDALLDALPPQRRQPAVERFAVKSGGRITFVSGDEIDWIEARGNYVGLHVGSDTHLLRETMANMERQLDPTRFVRIHRSTIVNLNRIRTVEPWFHGDAVVLLQDGTRLALSRTHRAKFETVLGKPL